jgi:hypothetical protein
MQGFTTNLQRAFPALSLRMFNLASFGAGAWSRARANRQRRSRPIAPRCPLDRRRAAEADILDAEMIRKLAIDLLFKVYYFGMNRRRQASALAPRIA